MGLAIIPVRENEKIIGKEKLNRWWKWLTNHKYKPSAGGQHGYSCK
jgi:hypothetical protein